MADRSEVIRPTGIRDARSMGEIVQDILKDVQEMFRSEFRLARAEMGEKAGKAAKAGGMFGAAAVCALLGAAALVAAAIAGLTLVMAIWLAALIMGVLLVCGAAAAYAGGRARMKNVTPVPEQTVQTIKDDVEWAKHRNR
jgi:hypothetical protein